MGALSPDSSKQCESLRLLGNRGATHSLGALQPVGGVSSQPAGAAGTATLTSPADGGSRMLVCGAECVKAMARFTDCPKGGGGDGSLLSNSDAFPEM